MPVIIEQRLGEQTGAVEHARVKRAPWLARRSRFGVTEYESP
jgi:hypothetical protein